jgi:formamidopyrimidine-DNA glycosylase
MPELPEVETVKRQLQKYVIGKKIAKVEVWKAKSFQGDPAQITNTIIQNVERRSKILRISLGHHTNLLIHLKMSGQLIFDDGQVRVGGGHPTPDWIGSLPSKHTRVQLSFADGSNLFFNDQRIFGWIKVASDEEVEQEFSPLAMDVIDDSITPAYFWQKIHHRALPIKQLLMDNAIVAGVGNIYACDAFNEAKISPFRLAKTLSQAEVAKLLTAAKHVIRLGIELGGATTHGAYMNVEGMAGKYQTVCRVYNKKDQPCPNCGHPIQKQKLAGRGTYWCSHCQT